VDFGVTLDVLVAAALVPEYGDGHWVAVAFHASGDKPLVAWHW